MPVLHSAYSVAPLSAGARAQAGDSDTWDDARFWLTPKGEAYLAYLALGLDDAEVAACEYEALTIAAAQRHQARHACP